MWLLVALTVLADSSRGFAVVLTSAESLHVSVAGADSATPVVLIPGLFGSAFAYRHVVSGLTAAGYRAIVIEPLGVGVSGRPEHADYSLTAQADRIAATLERLGVTRALVVAHSTSASIAYRLAYRHPGAVRGIVSIEGGPVEAAATPGLHRAMEFAPWIKLFGGVRLIRNKIRKNLIAVSGDPAWVSDSVLDGYTAGAARDLDGTLKALVHMARARERERLGPHLGEIACPVVLLLGGAPHDGGPRPAEVVLLAGSLRIFTADTVPGAGHFVHEERPDAVVAAVARLDARLALSTLTLPRLDRRLRGYSTSDSLKEAVMRAVVTGGAGFIGSHLIEALVARGDDVTCVERPGAGRRWLAGLEVRYCDSGLEDARSLGAAFAGANVVFHLAGLTEARAPGDYYAVNTEGTARVFEAAAALHGRAPRVILMSSLAALGPCRNGDRLSPDTVPYPISHYGHSKLLAEAIAHAFADRVPATIVRLTSVYGPRERGVLKLFQLVRRGVALTVGSWHREVSLVYVKDVVHGLLAAAASDRAANRTYCLAHPEPVMWSQFAHAVGRALGRDPILLSVPTPVAWAVAVIGEACARLRGAAAIVNRERLRELVQERWVCDPSRAAAELGFAPQYPVSRGVAETATWYREARWI